jgi:hypothetical protein
VWLRKPKGTRIADSDGFNFVGEKRTSIEDNVENLLMGSKEIGLKAKAT